MFFLLEFNKVMKMAVYSSENNCFFEHKIHTEPMTMQSAHYHDSHELYFLKKGRTKYFVDNEIFILEPGDMVFIPKFVFHKTDNGQCTEVERLRFSFGDDFAGKDFQKYIDELKQKRFIRMPDDSLSELENIINRLETEGTKKQKNYAEMQRLCFMQMLVLISRYCTTNSSHLTPSEQTIQNIAKYISENCGMELSLEALSRKYAMSPSHLCRLFKKTIGIGLSEYVNISRITAAEKLLQATDKTVTQIATECGFNDSNYFAAVFKKYKGTTPKKYSMEKRKS